MLAPQPRRPASRSSIATSTTAYTSPLSSWSGQMGRGSRGTSVTEWSDQATEIPQAPLKGFDDESGAFEGRGREVEEGGWGMEPPLIDFDEEPEVPASTVEGLGNGRVGGKERESHAEKLRMLLQQMEMEVHEHRPTEVNVEQEEEEGVRPVVQPRSNWRDGRRFVATQTRPWEQQALRSDVEVDHTGSRFEDHTPEEEPEQESEDQVEDSPPTPPLRFSNPYGARKTSGEKSITASSSKSRITSRAAVLRNSTSSNQSASISSVSRSPVVPPARTKTPLEAFIATHETPAPFRQVSDPSSSRSFDRSSTSSSSRKGKERAHFSSLPQDPPSSDLPSKRSPIGRTPRRSHTPRKWSVELAPEDSAVFAREAGSLEMRGEMELDIEESVDEPPWGSDVEESRMEEPPSPPPPPVLERTLRDTSRNTGRLTRVLSHPRSSPRRIPSREMEDSLPALPEPSYDSSEEETKPTTMSSRQESLFRSPSRDIPREASGSASRSFTRNTSRRSVSPNLSRVEEVQFAPPEPITVGMGHVSTPVKGNVTLNVPTPHPPGRWYSPSVKKSSPLAKNVDAGLLSNNEDVSIHRLRLSPAKKASPSPKRSPTKAVEAEDDSFVASSFIGRIPGLSRMIAKSHPLPRPSATLQEARQALSRAAESSSATRAQVDKTQRQFLEALAAAQAVGGGALTVAKRGWTWGNWAWWLSVEALLVWGVFRVTLDYASSAHHLSGLDPFALNGANSFALAVPLPTAISAFIVPHRGSANFFDLLEKMDLWRRLDEMGVLSSAEGVVVGGVRMLGGVPT